ncbi:hypothetical protein M409DRAFT_48433 [Zasmidium cellare ATCC 36951]|uniref:Amino acid permease/ SLC12A domain-containing protein n=1 Tax=Zasmidium cellare ATCC 36951 TaxID=1080233 RepID=A0A6A6D209_ZASCE|nr:uncharacterized protein M409DRAFT_48433 [Zasmidium cellare ATCC 36951]KAF2173457.1 hypothetical protein M409DRAFT_48433 [Zasmidium cellare ATCC 36951]
MIIAMSSWAYVLNGASIGLSAAGTGGTITIYICCAVSYTSIVLSMAELSSMIPLAGGPYHWVSVLATTRWRRILSYTAGWLLTLSWSCGVASGMFILASMIRTTAMIGDLDQVSQPWQVYLITLAGITACTALNNIGVRFLPALEVTAAIVFGVGLIVTIVVYAAMGSKNDATTVFNTFEDGGGWGNTGFAVLTGHPFALYCLFGNDGAAHMAEVCDSRHSVVYLSHISQETRDASLNAPRGMLWSYVFGATSGLGMLILFCYCYTEEAAITSETYGYAFIGVNLVVTGSISGAKGLTSIVIILTLLSINNFVAASSRQLMAFARDGGVPFGRWVSRIPPGLKYPINAVFVVAIFSALLNLITLGSTVAFQAIVSLTIIAFIGTYELAIYVLLWRRLNGSLPPARWSLGRLGLPINIFAALYGLLILAFIAVPPTPEFDAATFNWASVIFVGLMLLAVLFYLVGGRKSFEGPALKPLDLDNDKT